MMSDWMTREDKIAEIRRRHEEGGIGKLPMAALAEAHDDRATLLAEIERLRADLATQQGCCDGAAAQDAHIRREREEHRAKIERLRSDNERLTRERDDARAEVERMQELLPGISINMVDLIVQLTRERDKARAEVDRLRAEIERLRAEVAHGHLAHKAACEGGELLREEIKRLRAALKDIARQPEGDEQSAQAVAREALEGKP
jgi:chromosome segregation ATPase